MFSFTRFIITNLPLLVLFHCLLFPYTTGFQYIYNRHYSFKPIYALQNEKTYSVNINCNGLKKTLSVKENINILDAASDADLDIPYDCRVGNCQRCVGKVLSGDIQMDKDANLKESLVKIGYVLTCVTYPRSDLIITLVDESELFKALKEIK